MTAASVYILHVNTAKTGFETGMYGPLGPGGIYQINGATGAICPYASISNSGAGLGNIAYDPVNQRIDVSSFQDGLIYSFPKVPCGKHIPLVPFTFDHGLALPTAVPPRPPIPDIPTAFDFSQVGPSPPAKLFTPGFTPLGRRVWGLQFFDNRLYYSVWTSDARGAGTSPPPNEIWSVGLLAGGHFNATDVRLEKTIPPLTAIPPFPDLDYSNPVSGIAFSAKGKMLVAERVRNRDYGINALEKPASAPLDAHSARVLEFTVGGSTSETPKVFYVGNTVYQGQEHANSSGGADYGYGYAGGTPPTCDDTVAAMGDALRSDVPPGDPIDNNALRVYGLQLGPASGNSPNIPLSATSVGESSYFINLGFMGPMFPAMNFDLKTTIGSVAVARDCGQSAPSCLTTLKESVLCTSDGTGDYTYTFQVTNLSTTTTVSDLLFVDLPPGVTVSPNPVSLGTLAPGATSPPETVRIHGALPGSLTFRFLLLDQDGAVCCTVWHGIELPACDCAQVVSDGAVCSKAGGYDYTFSVQDLRNAPPISYVLVTPTTPGLAITQSGAAISPALNYGGVTTQTINVTGSAAQAAATACFNIGVHDASLVNCCTVERCITQPQCTNGTALQDLNLSLNTGLSPLSWGPQQNADPNWAVPLPQPLRSARLVLAPDSDWPWAIPGSNWISRNSNATSVAGLSAVRYRRCFCVGAAAWEATLDLALWADDRVSERQWSRPPPRPDRHPRPDVEPRRRSSRLGTPCRIQTPYA